MNDIPRFLTDPANVGLVALLQRLANRQRGIRLTAKETPWLFSPTPADNVEFSWHCLHQLAEVEPDFFAAPARWPASPEATPTLRLSDKGKALVVTWWPPEAEDPRRQQWQMALAGCHLPLLGELTEELLRLPLGAAEGYDLLALARALCRLPECLTEPLTLRQLSARVCFGDSKLLERLLSDELLVRLCGERACQLLPRPMLLTVSLPATVDGVLIIENLDTFLQFAAAPPESAKTLALVYGQGYKASAQRIRQRDSVRMAYLGHDTARTVGEFERCWFGNPSAEVGGTAHNETPLPVYFWGDLDFAGLAILRVLRQGFTDISAWRPGYERLLALLPRGHCHHQAGKGGQQPPLPSGCSYADEELMPALLSSGRFVDQEGFC